MTGAAIIVEPRTAAEVAVRDAFAAVLGLDAEAVSVEASFFELGGHSLRAILLARRLTEVLGREVGVATVLQRPTVAALAADNDSETNLPPLMPQVDDIELLRDLQPVSWNQSQLLTVHAADPTSAAYNMPMA
eukprot:877192-Prymnesium_polylepis.1